MKVFVYQLPNHEVLISIKTFRELRADHPRLELLRQFHTIQDARAWAEKNAFKVIDTVKSRYTGVTPEGRERMRIAKLGDNNPNANGLSVEHKQKIARAMKTRRGEFHHLWNRKHKPSSRMKTSLSMRRLPKRRWALDSQGNEHFLFAHMQLPPGWTWGRARGMAGFRR